MQALFEPAVWAALLTLTALEIILGIDNIIFLTIMTGRLPPSQQARGRILGLLGAMVTRILLLLLLVRMAQLTAPLVTLFEVQVSVRDLILLAGGIFLIAKGTLEIHREVEGDGSEQLTARAAGGARFVAVIVQVMLLDVAFSLDSVISAIGMTADVPIMIAAIVVAIIVMMVFSGAVSRFVDRHPTIRTLALSFLILIGMSLVGESFDFEVPKGYIYFAMIFSVTVELLNIRRRKRRIPSAG